MTPTVAHKESGSRIPQMFFYVYAFQFTTSVILNPIVLWLIAVRKEEYIRKYRILLSHKVLVCIRASFIFSTLQMCVHLRPLAAVITTKGPILSILQHSETAFVVFRIFFSDSPGVICIMALSDGLAAMYRYMAVTHCGVLREYVTTRNIVCTLICVHVLGLGVTVLGYSGLTWDQQFLLSYFPIGNGHMDFDTLYIGSHFSESPNFLIALFVTMCVSLSTIFFVFYCSKKVNDFVNGRRSLTRARNLAAQKLLVRALLIQAFMPCVLVVPLFVVTVCTLVTDTSPLLEYFCFSLIGWLPVLDPIITVYFVLPFRRVLLDWLQRLRCVKAAFYSDFYDL